MNYSNRGRRRRAPKPRTARHSAAAAAFSVREVPDPDGAPPERGRHTVTARYAIRMGRDAATGVMIAGEQLRAPACLCDGAGTITRTHPTEIRLTITHGLGCPIPTITSTHVRRIIRDHIHAARAELTPGDQGPGGRGGGSASRTGPGQP